MDSAESAQLEDPLEEELSVEAHPQGRISDDEFVAGLRVRKAESLRELEMKLRDPLFYGISMRILHDPEDVSEVMQEAFVKVYLNIEKFREGSNFTAWFCTIIKNLSISFKRKRDLRITAEYDESMPVHYGYETEEATAYHNPKPFGDNAEVMLERESVREILAEMVGRMGPEFRDVLWMHYVEEKSYRKMSAKLGVPLGTIMSRMNRARGKLRNILDADVELKEQLLEAA